MKVVGFALQAAAAETERVAAKVEVLSNPEMSLKRGT